MTKVFKINRVRSADDQMKALRDIVTARVREAVQAKVSIKHIAAQTGIGPGTISRLAYGETRFPRMPTVIAVLVYFDYDVIAVRHM